MKKQLIVLSALILTKPLFGEAQAIAQHNEDDATVSGLEEVVVTAERRIENVQEVPIAVDVVSGLALQAAEINDTSSLPLLVPGLDFTQQNEGATPFLRGVGSSSGGVGNESSVAIYVDGVYIASPQASIFSFNNIDRIEVLKGPQGTLFGRNASGGVVQVVTRDPQQIFSSTGSVGYGNYDTTETSFYATGGLTKDLAMDVSFYGRNQADGYGEDIATDHKARWSNNISARSKLLWTPTDNTEVRMSVDYSHSDGQVGIGYAITPGLVAQDGEVVRHGFYDNMNVPTDEAAVRQYGSALRVDQDLGWSKLVSISSYRRTIEDFQIDVDAVPAIIENATATTFEQTASQEVQLLSTAESKVNWLAGVFYYYDRAADDPLRVNGLEVGGVDTYINIYGIQTTRSYAGFVQATLPVTDTIDVTAGARYTYDARAVSGRTLVNAVPVVAESQSANFKEPTYRLAVDKKLTPDSMIYASYNRGFKSGLFNVISYTDSAVKPELLDDYELGWKFETADKRLRLNAAAFYYNFRNIQLEKDVEGSVVLLNAAAARMKGVDISADVSPIRRLTLSAGLEYLHGRYESFPDAPTYTPSPAGGNIVAVGDATGNPTIHSPTITASFLVSFTQPTSIGDIKPAVSYYYNSGFNWDPFGEMKQPSYSIVNASIGWTSINQHWFAKVWGKNLLKEEYSVFADPHQEGNSYVPAPPLTFGVNAGFQF